MSKSRGCFAALALFARLAQGSPDGASCPRDVTPASLSHSAWRLERACDEPGSVALAVRTDGGLSAAAELSALATDTRVGTTAVRVNRAAVTDGGGLELGWSETHTWPAFDPCTNSVTLEAHLVCSPQCALTVSAARSQSRCRNDPRGDAGCVRAPLSAGQSWIETVTTTEQHRSEPSRPDYDGLDQKSRLRTLKIVVGAADGGLSLASLPLGVSLPWPRGAQGVYPSFKPGAPLWPSELFGHGGRVFAGIVAGGPVRLVSRIATRHRLGPAHVFEVADGDGDASASCGGLGTITSERVEGRITVLDDTFLIVAADLVDDESEVNDRHFQDELEDGGVYTITGHWASSIHRRETIDVSCSADSSK